MKFNNRSQIIKARFFWLVLLLLCLNSPARLPVKDQPIYPWHPNYDTANCISSRVPVPPPSLKGAASGWEREPLEEGSFGRWLRYLPLKPGNPTLKLHDGRPKPDQATHWAIVDIDVGRLDLQQCADAIIRLRSEYLFSRGEMEKVHFNFASGDRVSFSDWARGRQPEVRGNRVGWKSVTAPGTSHESLLSYLQVIFNYANTASLRMEMEKPPAGACVMAGDVFIEPAAKGLLGHAVIVADTATDRRTGKRAFLLLQSFTPAQEVELLVNGSNPSMSPWYPADFGGNLSTPQWDFEASDLRRFRVE